MGGTIKNLTKWRGKDLGIEPHKKSNNELIPLDAFEKKALYCRVQSPAAGSLERRGVVGV